MTSTWRGRGWKLSGTGALQPRILSLITPDKYSGGVRFGGMGLFNGAVAVFCSAIGLHSHALWIRHSFEWTWMITPISGCHSKVITGNAILRGWSSYK